MTETDYRPLDKQDNSAVPETAPSRSEALNPEPSPPGIPDELIAEVCQQYPDTDSGVSGADLYSLQAALTTLSQETRLQGRSFKDMAAGVERLHASFAQALAQLGRLESKLPTDDAPGPDREILLFLVDLRDRLRRGLLNSQAAAPTRPPGLWRRLFGRRRGRDTVDPAVQALRHGYELTCEHLDEQLANWGVQEIPCLHQSFDPALMQAVAIVESDDLAEGTVVDVYRTGYRHYDAVLRLAEVKVTRNY